MINSLEPNQVFVFGSNIEGHHLGGAAKQAYEEFGAVWGVGTGLQGQSYAIPTMEGIENIRVYTEQFKYIAYLLPQFEFLLTRIGCGIAGYTDEEISPLFDNLTKNVIIPKEWRKE